MTLKEHLQRQRDAALGPVNRWYCAQCYGTEITDPDTLLEYFIRNGGADHFGEERKSDLRAQNSASARTT